MRLVDKATKAAVYTQQTDTAKTAGVSNCPICANGHGSKKAQVYALKEMEVDHVIAWFKGGSSDLANCEMLCITHNLSKGNR